MMVGGVKVLGWEMEEVGVKEGGRVGVWWRGE